jgi:glycine cleavage system H protein
MMSHQSNEAFDQRKELRCVWMDAGLVGYKLCDREFQCEACPFDELIRPRTSAIHLPTENTSTDPIEKNTGSMKPEHCFATVLENHLSHLNVSKLPGDRSYNRSHTWTLEDTDSETIMGCDHIASHLLEPIVGVVLPEIPSRVEQNAPFAWIVLREGTVALISAVSGTAVQSNAKLITHPNLLLDDPYGDGWILRVRTVKEETKKSSLHSVEDFGPLVNKQVDFIRKKLTAAFQNKNQTAGATSHDGGQPLNNIQEIIGYKTYFDIVSLLFVP